MKLENIRKLVAYGVSVIALLAAPHVEFITEESMFGMALDQIVSFAVAILGAVGVYKAKNEPLPEPEEE